MKRIVCILCILAFALSVFPAAASDSAPAFGDVEAGRYYESGVEYCVDNGLMVGVSETEFAPEESMSRAMFITVLWRMEGEPAPAAADTPFSDVRAGSYYESAVCWATENGIVSGTSDTAFSPDIAITREMMCTLFVRYAQYRGYSLPIGAPEMSPEWYHIDTAFASYEMCDPLNQTMPFEFYDSLDISNYAFDAVYVCYNAEVITGVTETEFAPQGTATRGQVATVIKRFMSKIAYGVTDVMEEGKVTHTLTDMLGNTFATQVDDLDGRGAVTQSVYTEGEYTRTEKYEYDERGFVISQLYEDSDGMYQRMSLDPATGKGAVEMTDGTVNMSGEYTLGEFGMDELILRAVPMQDEGYHKYEEERVYRYTYEDGVLIGCTQKVSVINKTSFGTAKSTTTIRNTYTYDECGVLCAVKVVVGADDGEYDELTFNAERSKYTLRSVWSTGDETVISCDKHAGTVTVIMGTESEVFDIEDFHDILDY